MSEYYEKFNKDGFIIIKNFINSSSFNNTCDSLNWEIEKEFKEIEVSKMGGSIIGNLNVYPGKFSKIILEDLKKNGIDEIIQQLTKRDLNNLVLRVGGNLALPNKYNQHFHTDGNFNEEMFLVSIATCDVNEENGPTEIVLETHKSDLPYWKFLLKKKIKKKIFLSKGDLVIRKHCLWHRGTVNKSKDNRFLIAYLYFDNKRGIKSNLEEGDKIKIYNNFFGNNFIDRFKEIIYVYFKFLFVLYKLVLSIKKK